LLDTRPEWTVGRLTAAAHATAHQTDDISLVGLAARIQDAVVLTAVRESVVLYAEVGSGDALLLHPEYVWKVDKDLAEHAKRFIDTFNALFGEELPPPEPVQAGRYWNAYDGNEILGRCVRIGHAPPGSPHYHWAICKGDAGEFAVQEFWHPEVWTTVRYRSALRYGGRCPDL